MFSHYNYTKSAITGLLRPLRGFLYILCISQRVCRSSQTTTPPPPSGSTLSRLVLIVLKCHIWRINFFMGPHTRYLQGTFNADSWSELSPVWVEVLVWLLANSDLSYPPTPRFSPSTSPLTTFATGIGSMVLPVTAGEEILPHHLVFSSLPPLSHPRTWVSPAKKSFFQERYTITPPGNPPKFPFFINLTKISLLSVNSQVNMRNGSLLMWKEAAVGYQHWQQGHVTVVVVATISESLLDVRHQHIPLLYLLIQY